MKCAVITPIGPGHTELYKQTKKSVEDAFQYSPGAFSALELIAIDDTEAQFGRSAARNLGVKQAAEKQCDWIFFLDADDVMLISAFADATPYLDEYDAVWGAISELSKDASQANIRLPQLPFISSIEELVLHDPFITLQMGHFIRTSLAVANPFDAEMDTGEDFKYYLDIWRKNKCIKQNKVFFANRRGSHSVGPRSADGRQWRIAVETLLSKEKQRLNNQGRLKNSHEIISRSSISIANSIKELADLSLEQCLNLSKIYPINDEISFEIGGKLISLHCENDDVSLLSHFWRKGDTLMLLLMGLTELAQSKVVYSVGSYTGITDVVMAVAANATVVSFEPGTWACERLKKNKRLNNLDGSVYCLSALPAMQSGVAEWSFKDQPGNLPVVMGAAQNIGFSDYNVETVDVVSQVKSGILPAPEMIVIRTGMPAASILQSMQLLVAEYKPDIIVELEPKAGLASGLFVEVISSDLDGYIVMELDLLGGNIKPALGAVSCQGGKWFLLRNQ